ncbi:MAG: HAD family phosphatase [Eubacterium sp.]|nr:HAD family phosphatase [Eubacterium sp.]
MIKNIVFDISNVLAPFRFKEYLAEKGFHGAMIKRIIKASAMTPYWTEYEKGKLTYEEAIEAFLSVDPDIREELHKAFDSCSGIMGRYDYTEGWIDALKGDGYKLYCITNFTPGGYEQCYDRISFIERFDGCVFSFREGITKPDPEIYKVLLRKYGLKSEECVFIDDTEENVLSAEELGFEGIVFTGYEDAVSKLDEILKKNASDLFIGNY